MEKQCYSSVSPYRECWILWVSVRHLVLNNKAFSNKKSLLSVPTRTREMRPEIACQCQKNSGQQRRNLAPKKSRWGSDLVFIWLFHVLALGGFDEVSAKKARGCFSFLLLAKKGSNFTWSKGYKLVFGNDSIRRSFFLLFPSPLRKEFDLAAFFFIWVLRKITARPLICDSCLHFLLY